jgi:hypothetical protein
VPVPPKKGASQKEWDWYKSAVWADKQLRSRPSGKAFADMRAQAEKNARNKPAAPKPSKAELSGDTVKLTHGVWRPGENPRVTWVRDALRKGGENTRRDARRRGQRLFDAPKKGGLYKARKTVEAAARPELATEEARKLRGLRDAGVDVIHTTEPPSVFHHKGGGVFGHLAASGRPTPQQIKKAEKEKPERAAKNAQRKQEALWDVNEAHNGDVARGGVQYYGDEPNREEQLWKREDAHAPRRTNDFSEHPWETQGPSSSSQHSALDKKKHRERLAFRDKVQKEIDQRGGAGEKPEKPYPNPAQQERQRQRANAEKLRSARAKATQGIAPKIGKAAGRLGLAGSIIALLSGSDPLEAAGFDVERAGETAGSKAAWIRRNPKLLAEVKGAERRYAVAQAKRQAANDHYWRGK